MADIKLDVSGVKIAAPVGYTADTCKKIKSKACKAFVNFASTTYSGVVRQLDEKVNSVKDKYLDKQKITKLEDVCPDIRLSKSAVSNFYPENVASTFARLTECRQRLANAIFSDSPVPSIRELAATQCLKVELKETTGGEKNFRFMLPVGINYKNCFEMTLPLAKNDITQLIDVRLPDGYEVASPREFKLRGWEGDYKAYRWMYIRDTKEDKKTFLVRIRPTDGIWRAGEISVLLVAMPVPAME